MKAKTPKKPKDMSPQAVAKREAARARRWKKTGVSDATVAWMKDRGML